MDICDKVGSSSLNAKDCLRAIVRRLGNPDPHIVVQAITVPTFRLRIDHQNRAHNQKLNSYLVHVSVAGRLRQ